MTAQQRLRTSEAFGVLLLLLALALPTFAQEVATLPETQPLTASNDLSVAMVAGIDRFLTRLTEQSPEERQRLWNRDFSSPQAYAVSVATNRQRFRKYIGAVDERVNPPSVELVTTTEAPALLAENDRVRVSTVRWPVFPGVFGEGLLIEPKGKILARVVALPDADQTPEMIAAVATGLPLESQFARRLAENGCQTLIPVLISRQDTWSGNPALKRFTNQPHREWIYRQAYEMGRHIIGYEVQKVLAAVDWFERQSTSLAPPLPIGVFGYAEGGLIALYAAALDTRITAAGVSGYFDSRQALWSEPIYRNVFGLLHEFGDAEIASLIAPRSLIVEYSEAPSIKGPPPSRQGRGGAAPGKWSTPEFNSVELEVARANALVKPLTNNVRLIHGNEGMPVALGCDATLSGFLAALTGNQSTLEGGTAIKPVRALPDPDQRQQRQVEELVEHTQTLLRLSEPVRDAVVWKQLKTSSLADYAVSSSPLKSNFWEEVIGRLPAPTGPLNARSRKIYDRPKWTGYYVVLDVYPDVFAWGVLLLPKDMKAAERRSVVVCQHGLEGVPADTITDDPKAGGYGAYKAFAARLAERGFVVFSPHNPYRGGDKFRVLQRKANPLKKSLFSVILAQHERILDWLSEQPFVDSQRIGFYGLSYGGKTAMRVPSLLDRYVLSICSADFNEWIKKNVTVDSAYSYLFTGEYEMFEFNLGHTFNYAEMGALIAPRPFMVERGHSDGVAPDEWVAYEFAKIRRHYARLKLPERTEIEFFDGPHTINGIGTFSFLHRHLNWPGPSRTLAE
jgi:dienelactone hydrolase